MDPNWWPLSWLGGGSSLLASAATVKKRWNDTGDEYLQRSNGNGNGDTLNSSWLRIGHFSATVVLATFLYGQWESAKDWRSKVETLDAIHTEQIVELQRINVEQDKAREQRVADVANQITLLREEIHYIRDQLQTLNPHVTVQVPSRSTDQQRAAVQLLDSQREEINQLREELRSIRQHQQQQPTAQSQTAPAGASPPASNKPRFER